MRTRLTLQKGITNARVGPMPRLPPVTRDAEINIEYDRDRKTYEFRAWGDEVFPATGRQYRGWLTLDEFDLDEGIRKCLDAWQRQLVERRDPRTPDDTPFASRWDLSRGNDPSHLQDAGAIVAQAGHDLFNLLLAYSDDGLKEIFERLIKASQSGERVITIHSVDCFIPWRLLYLPAGRASAQGSPWTPEGFWGHRHIVEQQLRRADIGAAIHPDKGLQVSLNVDANLDDELNVPFNAAVERFFMLRTKRKPVVRRDKDTLRRALESDSYRDDILYFGCHGQAPLSDMPPNLTLTDRTNPIQRTDFKNWFGVHPPKARPVVFINACRGGQMSPLFYHSFSEPLLASGANCVIGAQTDLPAPFAAEFANRFFDRLLSARDRAGDIVRALTREFIERHRNPLGLVYSMYHGIDTHFIRAVD